MLQFAAPAFLWGLIGLALPIIAHLIHREVRQVVRFPSLRFITQGRVRSQGKRRLRDRLLLLLRCLVLALAVFALAQPFWRVVSPPDAAKDEREEQVVILADASESVLGRDLWANVQSRAEEILAANPNARTGVVVSNGERTRTMPLSAEERMVRRALENGSIEIPGQDESAPEIARYRAGYPEAALREAANLFTPSARKKLVIISDFQASDWERTSFAALPVDAEVEWARLDTDAKNELALTEAQTTPIDEDSLRALVTVKNYGEAEAGASIILETGSAQQKQDLTLGPKESGSLSFIFNADQAGPALARLEQNDGYPTDDRLHFWGGAPPPVKVLAVIPAEREPEKLQEFVFIEAALGVKAPGDWLSFIAGRMNAQLFRAEDLEAVPAALLLGAPSHLETEEMEGIANWIREGGTALVTLGRTASLQIRALQNVRLYAGSFRAIREFNRLAGEDPARIAPLPESSRLAEVFEGDSARDLYLASIYRHSVLEPGEDSEVILQSETGDPLIVRQSIGSGSIYISAFDFSTEWTDLPLRTSFLPIIRELLREAVPPDLGVVSLETGADPRAIQNPSLRALSLMELESIDTSEPGVQVVADQPVQVNAPRSESPPETLTELELSERLATTGPAAMSGSDAAATVEAKAREIPLWPWLALLALILYAAEVLLANDRKKPSPSAGHVAPSSSAA